MCMAAVGRGGVRVKMVVKVDLNLRFEAGDPDISLGLAGVHGYARSTLHDVTHAAQNHDNNRHHDIRQLCASQIITNYNILILIH